MVSLVVFLTIGGIGKAPASGCGRVARTAYRRAPDSDDPDQDEQQRRRGDQTRNDAVQVRGP